MSNLIVCPYCGKDIEDNSKYCDQCGGQLKKCQTCGQIGKGNRCTKDGDKMIPVGSTSSQSGNSPSQNPTTPTVQPIQQTPVTPKYPVTFSAKGTNGIIEATADGKNISSGDTVCKDQKVIFTAKSSFGYQTKKTWKRNNKGFKNSTDVFVIAKLATPESITVEFKRLFSVKKRIGFFALIVILLGIGVLLFGYFRDNDSSIIAKYNPIPHLKNIFPNVTKKKNEPTDSNDTETVPQFPTQEVSLTQNPPEPPKTQTLTIALSSEPEKIQSPVDYNAQAKINNERGVEYYKSKDFDRAIVEFTEAIRQNPNYAAAHYNRSLAYYGKGNNNEAILGFTEAIRLEPNNAVMYNSRGVAYWNNGEYDRAVKDYAEALKIDPNYDVARQYLERAKKILELY